MRRIAVVLLGALFVLNIIDIEIHALIDQLEPLRVTSNVAVIAAVGAIAALIVAHRVGSRAVSLRRAFVMPLAAAAVYLTLNLSFIAQNSIGVLGAILVAATTVLLLVLAYVLARGRTTLPA